MIDKQLDLKQVEKVFLHLINSILKIDRTTNKKQVLSLISNGIPPVT